MKPTKSVHFEQQQHQSFNPLQPSPYGSNTKSQNSYNPYDQSFQHEQQKDQNNQQLKKKNTIPLQNLRLYLGIVFTKKLLDNQIAAIMEQFQMRKFEVKQSKTLDNQKHLIFIGFRDVESFFEHAELLKIKKPPLPNQTSNKSQMLLATNRIKSMFNQKQNEALNKINKQILYYESFETVSLQDLLQTGRYKTDEELINYFTPAEQLRIVHSLVHNIRLKEKNLVDYLKQEQILKQILPLHSDYPQLSGDIQELENYFGEDVSLYFRFLDFYQKWLFFPGVLGLIVFISDLASDSDQAFSWAGQAYAFVVMIWITIFIIFWKRKESAIAIQNTTFGAKITKRDKNVNFKGSMRLNIVTGLPEQHFSSTMRFLFYILSFVEALPLLIVTTALKLVIFNLNGFITNENSVFFVKSIAAYGQEGALLTKIPGYKIMLNLITVIVIFKIYVLYNKISKISTQRENHETNYAFQNSLFLKRFFFELINRFFHFFYLAFAIHDLALLKENLLQLFMIDEFRKVVTECVLPIVLKRLSAKSKQRFEEENQKKLDLDAFTVNKVAELSLMEYENYDDYVEVIFQMFYCTVFAAVFPLSATLSVLFNFVEIYSDKYKLVNKLYMRSLPCKVKSIGIWILLMSLISIFCVYSNITLIAFNYFHYFQDSHSAQHESANEFLKTLGGKVHEQFFAFGKEASEECSHQYMIVLVFVMEHFIILLLSGLRCLIDDKPYWVQVFRKRDEHLHRAA